MAHVYILYSPSIDIYYIGSTGNLEDRLKRHNAGRSNFTKRGVPWTLVYSKEFPDFRAASPKKYYIPQIPLIWQIFLIVATSLDCRHRRLRRLRR